MTLTFSFYTPQIWEHRPIEYQPARELADRHYSRQTVGAKGFVGPGQRFLLWHESVAGRAAWAVCRGMDPTGAVQWRNTFFRNESTLLTSDMIIAATATTYDLWSRRYGIPTEPLTTEIDIEATADRRSKRNPPGHCYAVAGWVWFRSAREGHGRSRKAIYHAPPPFPPPAFVSSIDRYIDMFTAPSAQGVT